MIKNQPLYGNTTHRRRTLHPDMVHSFQGEKGFTKEEQRLYKILSEANHQTCIGLSIRSGLSGGELGRFKKLISELKDQCRDARKELISAIGIEAVTLIESISHSS